MLSCKKHSLLGAEKMIFLRRFRIVRTDRPGHGWSSHFDNEIGFFQEIFAEKPTPLCLEFRISMIRLDIFYWKWHSRHYGNSLASQFWQMKAPLEKSQII